MAMLKQLTMNVPLVEALEQMPENAKFMKDLLTKKRAVSYEPMDNLHHCSVVSTRSLVQKKADPGAFIIPCTIGPLDIAKALCDLEVTINLMPLAMYKKLGLGDPTPTNIRLVMADRSIKRPIGIQHGVLVKASDFILPNNFIVLDCDADFKVSSILGRSFLTNGRVIVDMELNELIFRLNDKEARFAIHSPMTQQKEISVFSIMDVFYEDGKKVSAGIIMAPKGKSTKPTKKVKKESIPQRLFDEGSDYEEEDPLLRKQRKK
ncbi:uncharacterized protein LOC107853067 [Capsicum annuum]|uniref:uncharacterized protein LOC107853067 n=1 Tax=Capsicum annuum TaxID=4072 RepID=UPI001FB19D92|nr:uncharacterized protein LOC107853067 [Capsicum annuum]